ncbi:MAG: isochorismatase family cysteine hydrolase [Solirubrobacterales bacterium]
MTEFASPFAPANWPLTPNRTALVLIDLQNDLLDPNGWYARSGIDISHMRRVIEPTRELVAAAREASVPIIWTQHGFHNLVDAGTFVRIRPFLKDGGFRVGSWGYDIYDAFEVADDDWIVHKNRLSAFYNTNLELILRGLNADSVIFTGILTNQCVAATSKDAQFRDMKPVIVEECTGTTVPELHEPVLKCIQVGWGDVRPLDHVVTELASLRGAAEPERSLS